MTHTGLDSGIAAIASLAEPTRRSLYLYALAQGSPVSRDEAAAGVGVPRHTAKFHLDKLVSDGLLEVGFGRRTGRRGPGAGRPAKLYRRAAKDFAVTLPDRRYELAGQLMARAISDARTNRLPADQALAEAARDHGRMLGDQVRATAGERSSAPVLLNAVRQVLDGEGYGTQAGPAGLTLANCPFHALAVEHTDTVCAMNLAIMEGMVGAARNLPLAALLEPAEGRCCVRLAANGNSGT